MDGELSKVKKLLSSGADPDQTDSSGYTPLVSKHKHISRHIFFNLDHPVHFLVANFIPKCKILLLIVYSLLEI